MHNLCSICVRAGSKGVANKNLRNIKGKPLFVYSIQQAFECGLFKYVVVSTDSTIIAKIAKKHGINFCIIRPSELASDIAPKLPVIRHAVLESEKYFNIKFDNIVDLDATSPLRKKTDIINAYDVFLKNKSNNLITACLSRKNPYYNVIEVIDGKIQLVKKLNKSITRRQDAPITYDMNASIYIWKRDYIISSDEFFTNRTSLYIMPENRSIDIDSEFDFDLVEYLLNKHNEKID